MPINSAITERGRFLCHVHRETERGREGGRGGAERRGHKEFELTGMEREGERGSQTDGKQKGESGETETDRQTETQTQTHRDTETDTLTDR